MNRLQLYWRLARLDKPIGILLLLWPTLWGLVWAGAGVGMPSIGMVLVFVLGTVLMRSAGCVVNDYADRNFDLHVERTANRPLTSGQVSGKEALLLALALTLCAALLLLFLNPLARQLSLIALVLAASYPFFKRFFAIPQAYLGIAFGFGIPMAFAAVQNQVPAVAWWLLLANVFWTIAYDTEYAMVDKNDDLKIGIKTSAITFGRFDVAAVMLCYAVFIVMMAILGVQADWRAGYFVGLAAAVLIAVYHYTLIRGRERGACFKAFLHNHWLGLVVCAGTLLGAM
ncbi:MAG: 4-hydroxybenzoate octaprenyltransferase [Burkholderiales bacterium]|nr:4-hydroxybenzoate octaprenyltransferase [Burkholderiales bacterium]